MFSRGPALIGIKKHVPPRWPFHVDMDHPHAEGLSACWLPVGDQVFEVTGLHKPGAISGATLPAIDISGEHSIDTGTGTTDADIVPLGSYRLPASTTRYSALHRARNMNTIAPGNRYFAFGQTDLSGFGYDWGGMYIDSTNLTFWPKNGSSVTGFAFLAAGADYHWIGAYDSGVRTNQYLGGVVTGTSTSISGSPGTAYDLAVGPRWASLTSWRQYWHETAIYEDFFIGSDLAADMADRPYAKFVETGRVAYFDFIVETGIVTAAIGDAAGDGFTATAAIGTALSVSAGVGDVAGDGTTATAAIGQTLAAGVPGDTAGDGFAAVFSSGAGVSLAASISNAAGDGYAPAGSVGVSLSASIGNAAGDGYTAAAAIGHAINITAGVGDAVFDGYFGTVDGLLETAPASRLAQLSAVRSVQMNAGRSFTF